MSFRFFPSLKKWPMAVQEALSLACESDFPGDIRRISFSLGKPEHGKLPVSVDIDGHRALFCEVSDFYPVLDDLRDWMERCLAHDRNGTFHPEIVTLNLADSVYSLVLVHAGWEDCGNVILPVSVFVIVREDNSHPLLCEFCYPVDTLRRLYLSIKSCLNDHRRHFDDPRCWYDVNRFDKLDTMSHTDRLLMKIKSRKIELTGNISQPCTGY